MVWKDLTKVTNVKKSYKHKQKLQAQTKVANVNKGYKHKRKSQT